MSIEDGRLSFRYEVAAASECGDTIRSHGNHLLEEQAMSLPRILVAGATGTNGRALLDALSGANVTARDGADPNG